MQACGTTDVTLLGHGLLGSRDGPVLPCPQPFPLYLFVPACLPYLTALSGQHDVAYLSPPGVGQDLVTSSTHPMLSFSTLFVPAVSVASLNSQTVIYLISASLWSTLLLSNRDYTNDRSLLLSTAHTSKTWQQLGSMEPLSALQIAHVAPKSISNYPRELNVILSSVDTLCEYSDVTKFSLH